MVNYDWVIERFLCCPYDRGKLAVSWALPNVDGRLSCVECKRAWEVVNGIISLMPDYYKNREPAEKNDLVIDCLSEISSRDRQAKIYDRILSQRRNIIELQTTTREFKPNAQDIVAEVGAGTGRALGYSGSCKLVIACDYSQESLMELRNKGFRNVIPVQADVTQLPIRSAGVEKILSVGLFHHIPSQSARRKHLEECDRILVDKGEVLMSGIYNFTLKERLRDVKMVYTKDDTHGGADGKTGYHTDNTIYYYNFDIRELKAEVKLYFDVVETFGFFLDLGIWGRSLERIFGPYRSDSLWHRTKVGNWLGQLLLIKMKKPQMQTARAEAH
jgi:uncharacterized protein YbaR (Trm112 family)